MESKSTPPKQTTLSELFVDIQACICLELYKDLLFYRAWYLRIESKLDKTKDQCLSELWCSSKVNSLMSRNYDDIQFDRLDKNNINDRYSILHLNLQLYQDLFLFRRLTEDLGSLLTSGQCEDAAVVSYHKERIGNLQPVMTKRYPDIESLLEQYELMTGVDVIPKANDPKPWTMTDHAYFVQTQLLMWHLKNDEKFREKFTLSLVENFDAKANKFENYSKNSDETEKETIIDSESQENNPAEINIKRKMKKVRKKNNLLKKEVNVKKTVEGESPELRILEQQNSNVDQNLNGESGEVEEVYDEDDNADDDDDGDSAYDPEGWYTYQTKVL